MGDIETAYDLHAETAREPQSSDPILSQLALATIMLSLEVDLRAFVRALNGADATAAPIEQSSHRPLARRLRGLTTMNIRFPWRSTDPPLRHSPA